jgi:Bacterial regulatory protein, Fis family
MTETLKNKIQEMEREEIIHALEKCDWIMARAARKLGITERMIAYKIRKYGIIRPGRQVTGSEEKSVMYICRNTSANIEKEGSR